MTERALCQDFVESVKSEPPRRGPEGVWLFPASRLKDATHLARVALSVAAGDRSQRWAATALPDPRCVRGWLSPEDHGDRYNITRKLIISSLN